MPSKENNIRDLLWEIVRRHQEFVKEYHSFKENDDGQKRCYPGFKYMWHLNKFYDVSMSIDDIKRYLGCDCIDDDQHPISLKRLEEKTKNWISFKLNELSAKKKTVATKEEEDRFFDSISIGSFAKHTNDDIKYPTIRGEQLSLFNDNVDELDLEDDFEEEKVLGELYSDHYIVNTRSVSTYIKALAIYDKVQSFLVKKNGHCDFANGAITLPEDFPYYEVYDNNERSDGIRQRIDEFDMSIFEDPQKVDKIREKYQLKDHIQARHINNMDIECLKQADVEFRTDDALDTKYKRAFNKISDFISHLPLCIVLKPAIIKP